MASLSQLPRPHLTVDILEATDDMRSDSGADQRVLDSQRAFIKANLLDKAGRTAEAWTELVAANELKQKLLERDYPTTSRSVPENLAAFGKLVLWQGAQDILFELA